MYLGGWYLGIQFDAKPKIKSREFRKFKEFREFKDILFDIGLGLIEFNGDSLACIWSNECHSSCKYFLLRSQTQTVSVCSGCDSESHGHLNNVSITNKIPLTSRVPLLQKSQNMDEYMETTTSMARYETSEKICFPV